MHLQNFCLWLESIGYFLIPNIIVSVIIVFPLACRFSNMSIRLYFKKAYLPVVFVSIPSILFLYFITDYIPLTDWNLLYLLSSLAISGIIYFVMGLFFYFNKDEKNKFFSVIPFLNKFSRKS